MKLGITGSREAGKFDFSPFFSGENEIFNKFLNHEKITEIITGGAKGIDSFAKRDAAEKNIAVKNFLPDYRKYHRSALLKRNERIVNESDAIFAAWNGFSKETLFTINYALSCGKKVFLVRIGKDSSRIIGKINR